MGRHPTNNRKYVIKHMWDRHHEIIRLLVMGMAYRDIANTLKITPQTVSDVANSPIVQEKLLKLRGERDVEAVDIGARIKKLAPSAVAKVKEVMDKGDLRTSLTAARDILDRSGFVPPTKIDMRGMIAHVTTKELDEIKERQKKKGIVVEGEVVEERNAE